MKIVNMHEAKTHLSRLTAEAVNGNPFIIAKAGVPMVMVSAWKPPASPTVRTGFMRGEIRVPADFDEIGSRELETLFSETTP